jgi:hypothetical protein
MKFFEFSDLLHVNLQVLFPPAQNSMWMHSMSPGNTHATEGITLELKPQDIEKVCANLRSVGLCECLCD